MIFIELRPKSIIIKTASIVKQELMNCMIQSDNVILSKDIGISV